MGEQILNFGSGADRRPKVGYDKDNLRLQGKSRQRLARFPASSIASQQEVDGPAFTPNRPDSRRSAWP